MSGHENKADCVSAVHYQSASFSSLQGFIYNPCWLTGYIPNQSCESKITPD